MAGTDIGTLTQWLSHDVLVLAGPTLGTRQVLSDFLVDELAHREPEDVRRIRPVRVALQNQRVDLLAFDGVLHAKLADIAQAHVIPEPLAREACAGCAQDREAVPLHEIYMLACRS